VKTLQFKTPNLLAWNHLVLIIISPAASTCHTNRYL